MNNIFLTRVHKFMVPYHLGMQWWFPKWGMILVPVFEKISQEFWLLEYHLYFQLTIFFNLAMFNILYKMNISYINDDLRERCLI